jgi:hypothetical protein
MATSPGTGIGIGGGSFAPGRIGFFPPVSIEVASLLTVVSMVLLLVLLSAFEETEQFG